MATPGTQYMTTPYPTLPTTRQPVWSPPDAAGMLLAFIIWIPSILVFSMFWMIGLRAMAVGAVALAMVVHSLTVTRVAVYFLVLAIVADHLISSSFAKFTPSKMVGVWVFIVSIPKILSAISENRYDASVKWFLTFVGVGFLSIMFSSNISFSAFIYLTFVLVFGLLLLFGIQIVEWPHFRALLIFLIIGGVMLSIQAISMGAASERVDERMEFETVVGEGGSDITEAARLMGYAIIATIYLFMTHRNLLMKLSMVAVGLLVCVGTVMTKSRACYVSLPIATVVASWLTRGISINRRLLITAVACLLTVSVFFLGGRVGFAGAGVKERFESIFDEGDVGGRGIRFYLWQGYLKSTVARGFLPYGPYGTRVNPEACALGAYAAAHNTYIQVVGDFGAIGVIVFLGFNIHLLRRIYRVRTMPQQYFAWTVFLNTLVTGMFATELYRKCYGVGLGLILLTVRLSEQDRRRQQQWEMEQQAAYLTE